MNESQILKIKLPLLLNNNGFPNAELIVVEIAVVLVVGELLCGVPGETSLGEEISE